MARCTPDRGVMWVKSGNLRWEGPAATMDEAWSTALRNAAWTYLGEVSAVHNGQAWHYRRITCSEVQAIMQRSEQQEGA